MKIGVVVVDMLNDFVTGVLTCERAPRVIPNIRHLLDFARKKGTPFIYTNDAHMQGFNKEEDQKNGLKYLKTFYGCKITKLHELMKTGLV